MTGQHNIDHVSAPPRQGFCEQRTERLDSHVVTRVAAMLEGFSGAVHGGIVT